jgi:flagellar biosynthesis/type III secretory pathway protein FliH
VLPEVISQIRTVAEPEQQGRLFTSLVALLDDEEVIQRVEKILDEEQEWVQNAPYLRRLYQRGLQEGRQEGLQEGLQEGREEGRLDGLRTAILSVVKVRFDPPISLYETIERGLLGIVDRSTLQQLLMKIVQVEQLAEFVSLLPKQNGSSPT